MPIYHTKLKRKTSDCIKFNYFRYVNDLEKYIKKFDYFYLDPH